MSPYKMTVEEKLRGIRKGIRTLRKKRGGPKWLIPSMRRYERELLKKLTEERRR